MPVMSGFEMLSKLNYQPRIIFTTAYEAYAIKAFEENSVDYLLKPVEPERLEKAIVKLKQAANNNPLSMEALQQVVSSLNTKKELRAFPVKVGDKIIMLKPDEISYFEAREKYVFIVTENNREFITDFTLTVLEEKLPETFLRVHRAFIINTSKIKEIHKGFSGSFSITMADASGTHIHTGRSYGEQVRRLMEI
jgi:two-component system LytT family response regulator